MPASPSHRHSEHSELTLCYNSSSKYLQNHSLTQQYFIKVIGNGASRMEGAEDVAEDVTEDYLHCLMYEENIIYIYLLERSNLWSFAPAHFFLEVFQWDTGRGWTWRGRLLAKVSVSACQVFGFEYPSLCNSLLFCENIFHFMINRIYLIYFWFYFLNLKI